MRKSRLNAAKKRWSNVPSVSTTRKGMLNAGIAGTSVRLKVRLFSCYFYCVALIVRLSAHAVERYRSRFVLFIMYLAGSDYILLWV